MRVTLFVVLFMTAVIPAEAQDAIFYDDFEEGDTAGWWAPARVGETGLDSCYDSSGGPIDCAGTGQDGDIKPGVAWPNPRFIDNSDGTVTDMLTGLVWLKNAQCFGSRLWANALLDANTLASGNCGLTDGSVAGDWRLPSRFELASLLDLKYDGPALSNTSGTGQWSEGDAFLNVHSVPYWSSTTFAGYRGAAWAVYFSDSFISPPGKTDTPGHLVWPVRNGQ